MLGRLTQMLPQEGYWSGMCGTRFGDWIGGWVLKVRFAGWISVWELGSGSGIWGLDSDVGFGWGSQMQFGDTRRKRDLGGGDLVLGWNLVMELEMDGTRDVLVHRTGGRGGGGGEVAEPTEPGFGEAYQPQKFLAPMGEGGGRVGHSLTHPPTHCTNDVNPFFFLIPARALHHLVDVFQAVVHAIQECAQWLTYPKGGWGEAESRNLPGVADFVLFEMKL